MRFKNNKRLAEIFSEMAAMYKYLGGENAWFREKAYRKGAKVMESLERDISKFVNEGTLKKLSGISSGLAEKIEEFLESGKINQYEELRKNVPKGIIEMMGVKGLGPKTLKQIHDQLKISSRAGLVKAINEDRIAGLRGFGAKKLETVRKGLKKKREKEENVLLWNAIEDANEIISWLKQLKEVKYAEAAGEVRRRIELVRDVTILVCCSDKSTRKIIDHFTSEKIARLTIERSSDSASIVMNETGRRVNLKLVNEETWGAALLLETGSRMHVYRLHEIAKKKKLKITERGLFRSRTNAPLKSRTENEVYAHLGLQYIVPELREDRGEIQLAQENKIPELITIEDIRGDLQMHSDWSDAINTMEEVVDYVRKNFKYEYISFTDHSKAARVANGMEDKKVLEQIKFIDKLNKKLGENFIKKGLEVDILSDGTLDVSDELLQQLDWVVASIHSNFNRDNTDRIVKACENPFVNVIGHPTGRKLASRDPYPLNFDAVLEAAKATQTALEINAQANRMDINYVMAEQAREKGVMLVVSTDSHALHHFNFMPLGVYVARKAMCTAAHVLNTRSWKEIEKWRLKKLKSLRVLV